MIVTIDDVKKIIKLIECKIKTKYPAVDYYNNQPSPGTQKGDCIYNTKNKKIEVNTNWFKLLVNQKIDYSISKEPSYDVINMPDEFVVEDILYRMLLGAAIYSTSWLHVYVNESGRLDWVQVNDSNIIPIFDSHNKYISSIIYFELDEDVVHVQVWDPTIVVIFSFKDAIIGNVESKPHYLETEKYKDIEQTINPKGFGFVPFIPLYNNKNKESDLVDIKVLIDTYNDISTGFIDNVTKFQEALLILRGYAGTDFDNLWESIQKNKVAEVDKDGSMEYVRVDIPVEARKLLLELTKDAIFLLGRGVDPNALEGSSLTNVVIKSKYSNLDVKCSDMEKGIRVFYRQLVLMLNSYYNITIADNIIFNRAQIFNETEIIDNCVKSVDIISMATIIKNHPWVTSVEDEFKLINEEGENIEGNNTNPK
jgi:SPP1 family phage portal protein